MPSHRSGEDEGPLEELFSKVLGLVDDAVVQIADAEVAEHLRKVLIQAGRNDQLDIGAEGFQASPKRHRSNNRVRDISGRDVYRLPAAPVIGVRSNLRALAGHLARALAGHLDRARDRGGDLACVHALGGDLALARTHVLDRARQLVVGVSRALALALVRHLVVGAARRRRRAGRAMRRWPPPGCSA